MPVLRHSDDGYTKGITTVRIPGLLTPHPRLFQCIQLFIEKFAAITKLCTRSGLRVSLSVNEPKDTNFLAEQRVRNMAKQACKKHGQAANEVQHKTVWVLCGWKLWC